MAPSAGEIFIPRAHAVRFSGRNDVGWELEI